MSLSAARGHAGTPERPSRVESRPDRYRGYIATGNIRAGKTMRVITPQGVREMKDLSARERSLVAKHENAVKYYLKHGSGYDVESRFAEFEGMTVAGIPLATDPDDIESMSITGELDFDNVYTNSSLSEFDPAGPVPSW